MEVEFNRTQDLHIQKSILNKKILANLSDLSDDSSSHLSDLIADQFLIYGPDPKGKKLEPCLLSCFPGNSLCISSNELSQIQDFCFPQGFEPFLQLSPRGPIISNEFVFILNSTSSLIYGCVVQITSNRETPPFFVGPSCHNFPFALCILTRCPYLSTHFHFLTYAALALSGQISSIQHQQSKRTLFLSNSLPIHPELSKFGLIENSLSFAVLPGLRPPQFFLEDLHFYFSLPTHLIDQSDTLISNPIKLSSNINLIIPYDTYDSQTLAYCSMHTLFSCLTIPTIVKVFNALLLEYRVVFKSNNLHFLTLSVIAAISLLGKIGPLVQVTPLIPNQGDYHMLLQAPTPYIVGSLSDDGSADVIVNLTNNKIIKKNKIPKLPNEKALIHALNTIISDSKSKIKVPSKKSSSYQEFMKNLSPLLFPQIFLSLIDVKYILPSAVIDSILNLFEQHITPFLQQKMSECFVTDTTDDVNPITVFNKDLFLTQIPSKEHEFYDVFINTQIFNDFCNSLTDNFALERSASWSSVRTRKKSFSTKRDISTSISLPYFSTEMKEPDLSTNS